MPANKLMHSLLKEKKSIAVVIDELTCHYLFSILITFLFVYGGGVASFTVDGLSHRIPVFDKPLRCIVAAAVGCGIHRYLLLRGGVGRVIVVVVFTAVVT